MTNDNAPRNFSEGEVARGLELCDAAVSVEATPLWLFIAHHNPSTMRAVWERLRELEAENQRFREVDPIYENQAYNWCVGCYDLEKKNHYSETDGHDEECPWFEGEAL